MDSILLLLIGVLGIGGGVMNFLGYITASPRAGARSPKSFGGYMAAAWAPEPP